MSYYIFAYILGILLTGSSKASEFYKQKAHVMNSKEQYVGLKFPCIQANIHVTSHDAFLKWQLERKPFHFVQVRLPMPSIRNG